MMQDNENKRINAGYEIIATLPVGDVEFVVGQNIHTPNSSRGYYYAESRSDIEETIAHLDGRVSKIKAAQDGLREILNNYIGG